MVCDARQAQARSEWSRTGGQTMRNAGRKCLADAAQGYRIFERRGCDQMTKSPCTHAHTPHETIWPSTSAGRLGTKNGCLMMSCRGRALNTSALTWRSAELRHRTGAKATCTTPMTRVRQMLVAARRNRQGTSSCADATPTHETMAPVAYAARNGQARAGGGQQVPAASPPIAGNLQSNAGRRQGVAVAPTSSCTTTAAPFSRGL